MKQTFFRKAMVFVILLAVGLGLGIAAKLAMAGAESGSGFAWGGGVATNPAGYYGAGWISFNSTDCDTNNNGIIEASEITAKPGCPAGSTATYGVAIPSPSGNLSGYAWSEHYGWISFNGADLAGCDPVLPQATRNVEGAIGGGARILAIRDAGANAGGFDGCVSLHGSSYGVSVSGNQLTGYAWSSDLGWINMSGVSFSSAAVKTLKICNGSCGVSSADISVSSPSAMASGGTKWAYACYNSSPSCNDAGGGDVSGGTTLWEKQNTPSDALQSVTGGSLQAKVVTSNKSEDVKVTYNDSGTLEETTFRISVLAPACTCSNAAGHCSTETWNDSCGDPVCSGGTKSCSSNGAWKEVVP